MALYNETNIARTYSYNKEEYLRAFINRELETYTIGNTITIGINRKSGQLPKANLPYLILAQDKNSISNQTIVLTDGVGIQDTEFDFRYINSILTAIWEDPNHLERFIALRKFAAKAYMNWVSRGFASRTNIPLSDKMKVDILAATYFYSAGHQWDTISSRDNYKFFADISEITGMSVSVVTDVVEKIDAIGFFTINDMVEAMKKISREVEEKASLSLLTSVLAHSWYGEGGVFYCNLALEYPPTFLTLVYFALVDKSFQRSNFGVRLKEFTVGRNVDLGVTFVRRLNELIKNLDVKGSAVAGY